MEHIGLIFEDLLKTYFNANVIIFFVIYFVAFGVFSSSRRHLLIILLRSQFVVLVLYLSIIFICAVLIVVYFLLFIFWFFSVFEGSLDLSILVSIIRSHGNDYFQSYSVLQCYGFFVFLFFDPIMSFFLILMIDLFANIFISFIFFFPFF